MDKAASTFCMVDFYDYETQTTPVLTGLAPAYNFAATYKVETDNFFLRYLSTESLTVELARTRHGDFQRVAHATLPLRKLLESQGKLTADECPLVSVEDGALVGQIKVQLRLALPVTELFKVYLEEHPQEKARMDNLALADRERAEMAAERARAQNSIEVQVLSAQGLERKRGGGAPSSYVHYQLLQFHDVFSDVVPNTRDPVYSSASHMSLDMLPPQLMQPPSHVEWGPP